MKRILGTLIAAVVLSSAVPAHDNGWLLTVMTADNRVQIVERDGYRYITSNGLPNHETGRFPNRGNPHSIQEQQISCRVTLQPKEAQAPTQIGMNPFGIAINGIMLDPSAAEFWQRDPRSGWQYEAVNGSLNLGLDSSNAHVQPDGSYHYHGVPVALVQELVKANSMVMIGYAGDGFPIYAMLGHENPADAQSKIRKVKSSYQVREGNRPDGPRGRYDGSFVQDWEYVEGSGDLDEFNGRFGATPEYPDGIYHYYLTDTFPYIPRQWKGTPDQSFQKRRLPPQGGGFPGRGGRGPGGPPPPPGAPPPRGRRPPR
ncbi:MAG: YHYH protein [Planctomycetaceae bacterium]|nr:YHYH protein [Planctomycetaceae bacterium]